MVEQVENLSRIAESIEAIATVLDNDGCTLNEAISMLGHQSAELQGIILDMASDLNSTGELS